MMRVVSCLTTQHDWRLVILAGLICIFTSYVAVNLFQRAQVTSGRFHIIWLALTGVTAGFGIWATHFIAMLAYAPDLQLGYDLPLTLLSLLAAVILTGAGFWLASKYTTFRAISAAGAIVGLGIAIMHYSGMQALEAPGRMVWSWDLVAASIFLGCLFGMAALLMMPRKDCARPLHLAAFLLALAILAHHFTAMGAVEIVPDPSVFHSALAMSPHALAVAIASAATALLAISLTGVFAASSRDQLIETSDAMLASQAKRYEMALTNMSQGVCMFDKDQRIVVANPRYAEIYRLDPEEIPPGTPLRAVLEMRVARGVYGDADPQEVVEAGVAAFNRPASEILHLSDGRIISVLRQPMADGAFVSTHEDITERCIAEARIAHLAHHDVLTDLPNRALLHERLERAIAAMRNGGREFALIMLDLDRFKEVNDTLGHSAGDVLLKGVARRLLECVRNEDTVARLGGDEFVIVMRTAKPEADAVALAKRIQQSLSVDFEIEGHQVEAGASIGIAIAPQDGDDPDELLKHADLALYRAKSDGRGSFHLYEPEMDRRMQARRSLENGLRKAIDKGELQVHYQPLVNIEADEICGFEALLRWSDPERGDIPPVEFIPLAEETGLIMPLGEFVLRRACSDACGWPDHLKIAVNISPVQFKKCNLAKLILRILAETGLPPQRLELEITESAMLEDEEKAFRELRRLHRLGVRVALDDFGTGYSSLSNLRKFPFDKIKIDRAFVSDLSAANVDALAVVRSVAQLGVSLGMATTAEGVETKEQADQVRAEGCTEMQGHYICPPSPAGQIEQIIRTLCPKSSSAA